MANRNISLATALPRSRPTTRLRPLAIAMTNGKVDRRAKST
jgi:hypothetical protein